MLLLFLRGASLAREALVTAIDGLDFAETGAAFAGGPVEEVGPESGSDCLLAIASKMVGVRAPIAD